MQTITLNMSTNGVTPRVYVSQYDVGRIINLYLEDEDDIYTIPAGAMVNISGIKPDGTIFDVACTTSGNVATFTTTEQMTVLSGVVVCELTVYGSNDSILSTKNFDLIVEAAAVDLNKVSKDSLDGLQQIEVTAVNAAASATKSAETATDKASAAASSATEAASYAHGGTGTRTGEDADNSKYYSERSADSAKASASSASDSASSATASADSARASATSARNSASSATLSASYARGGTGMRTDEDTDNAMYYSWQSAQNATASASSAADSADSAQAAAASATNAATSELNAATSASNAASSELAAGTSATSAAASASAANASQTAAAASESNAASSADSAAESAIEAESYAHGGTGSRQDEATDNAAYYLQQTALSERAADASATSAASSATAAGTSETNAAASASAANTSAGSAADSAVIAESWAVGGTSRRAGEDTDNAKYYAKEAQKAAGGGVMSFNGRNGSVVPQAGDYDASLIKATDTEGITGATDPTTQDIIDTLAALTACFTVVDGKLNVIYTQAE